MGAGTNSCSLKVMTYNIEMKADDDDGGWAGRNTSSVVSTIVDASPDVVGLQEDDDTWYKDGAFLGFIGGTNHLAGLETAGYTSTNFSGYGDERLNIYYKTAKFDLLEKGTKLFIDLSNEEGFKDVEPNFAEYHKYDTKDKGRFFSYVVLKDKTSGAIVLVVNTHLHYTAKNTEFSDAVNTNLRAGQAKLLNAWMDSKLAQYPNQIVVGDLNNTPGTTAVNALGEGMEFARNSAAIKGDTGGTLCSTSDYVRRDSYVFDHIAYRGVTARYYSVVNNMIDLVDGTLRYPSDHLPVVTQFICSAE